MIKYTIAKEGYYLADENNIRMLFDNKDEAKEYIKKNYIIDCYVLGYIDPKLLKKIPGIEAYNLMKDGHDVYSTIFGLDIVLCNDKKWSFDDFVQGHFNFYITV